MKKNTKKTESNHSLLSNASCCIKKILNLTFSILLGASLANAVELPIEIVSHNADSAIKSIYVITNSGNSATDLYLEIHNLRYGGAASVRVNNQPWVDLYNHNVIISEPENSYGGIGGIHATLRMKIPLSNGSVNAETNRLRFRFNGTDGNVTAIRILDFDFLDAQGNGLIASGQLQDEDPSLWQPPFTGRGNINMGRRLWNGEIQPLINDPISQRALNSSCSSCHFDDGSDLKYFNYSNKTIVARAKFHGFDNIQAKQVASYIRTRNTIAPGRPWNPPFQPGPGLDAKPGEEWGAGAGLEAVIDTEEGIKDYLFPHGTSQSGISKVVEHEGSNLPNTPPILSIREIPVSMQFPDWNAWLPRFAPKDIWNDPSDYEEPWDIYEETKTRMQQVVDNNLYNETNLYGGFGKFKADMDVWFGQDGGWAKNFRAPNQPDSNLIRPLTARRSTTDITPNDVRQSMTRWMAVRQFNILRTYNLEDAASNVNEYGERSFPSTRRTVFDIAPHISARGWTTIDGKPVKIGKFLSHQWYQLQLTLNAGMRQGVNTNQPIDWDYQLGHLQDVGTYSNLWPGLRYAATMFKTLEARDNGVGITFYGFSPRITHPWRLFSTSYGAQPIRHSIDLAEEGLWLKIYEEYLYEWLDTIEGFDLNDSKKVPRVFNKHNLPPSDFVPTDTPASGEIFTKPIQNHANNTWRLIPLSQEAGVDELLLKDISRWAKKAWTTPNWDSLFPLSSIFNTDFETANPGFTNLNRVKIKNNNYTHNNAITPKNGGSEWVAEGSLPNGEIKTYFPADINETFDPNATQLRLKARIALENKLVNNKNTEVRISISFNPNGQGVMKTISGPYMSLDKELSGREFETYDTLINIPNNKSSIRKIRFDFRRNNQGANTVYIDNVQVFDIIPESGGDTTSPSTPIINGINGSDLTLKPKWNAITDSDLAGYNIYRSQQSNGPWINLNREKGLINKIVLNYLDKSVDEAVEYYYQVTAVDTSGNESNPSNTRNRTVNNTAPDLSPSNLSGTSAYPPTIKWFASETWDVVGYDIWRRVAGAQSYSKLNTNPINILQYIDNTAQVGTTYQYKVNAVDAAGASSIDSTPHQMTIQN